MVHAAEINPALVDLFNRRNTGLLDFWCFEKIGVSVINKAAMDSLIVNGWSDNDDGQGKPNTGATLLTTSVP